KKRNAAGATGAVEMNALVVADVGQVGRCEKPRTVEIVGDGGVGVPRAVGFAAALPEVVGATSGGFDDCEMRVLFGIGHGALRNRNRGAAHAGVEAERVIGREM